MSDPTTTEYYELASFHINKPSLNGDDYISDATSTENDLLQQQEQSQCPTLREDRNWSILSNSFFVTGCFFSLVGNSWDYILYTKFNNNVEGEDLQAMSDKWQYITYQSLSILWPIIFLMNSIIDVKWALVVQERMAKQKKRWKSESFVHKILVNNPTMGRKRDSLLLNTALVVPQNVLRRTRNHIGHRRQLGAATAFGVAASLSVSAAVLSVIRKDTPFGRHHWDALSYWTSILKYASVHMYLVSAILTLWKMSSSSMSSYCSGAAAAAPSVSSDRISGNIAVLSSSNNVLNDADTTPSCGRRTNRQSILDEKQREIVVAANNKDHIKWHSNVEFLATLGDVIFGIATVVDVFLQDFIYHEDEIFVWPIVQATVWSVDALLYLRSDYLSLSYVSVAYLWKDPHGQYV